MLSQAFRFGSGRIHEGAETLSVSTCIPEDVFARFVDQFQFGDESANSP